MKRNFALFLLFSASVHLSAQTTITFQPGSTGMDAHVDDYSPTAVDANYPNINAGYNTVGGTPTISHNFMQFDLSAIPAGSTIVSATLSLWHSPTGNHSSSTANAEVLAKVTQAWDESTITWNTQPTFSTTDVISIGTTNIGDDKPNIDLKSFVQDWVTTPATNFGMVMHLEVEPGTLGRFQTYASSDAADSTIRPKLVVTFNPPCANQTTILQPGSNGIDAHVDDYSPTAVDANYPNINAGYNTVGGTPTLSHNFMQFDLSSIPAGASIVSATLSLWHSPTGNHSSSSDNAEVLAKVTQAWDESTVTWNTQPTYSTTDVISIGTTSIGDDKPNIDLKPFVQDWVTTPATNFGMVMHLAVEPGNLGRFQTYASSDAADSTIRPKLAIVWSSCNPSGVKELTKENYEVSVYPNPANSVLHIQSSTNKLAHVTIYDMLGNKIAEEHNTNAVNVKDFEKGFYILHVQENNLSKLIKFIKD